MKAGLQNIWSGDGVLAAEWQQVSQADRQSGAEMSQAGLGALLLSLASWTYLLWACSGAVITDKAKQEAGEAVTEAAGRLGDRSAAAEHTKVHGRGHGGSRGGGG